jgi:pyruvate dehydrogenase E2 component (dihydrolipoamide acetyltransferase)
MTEPIRIVMPRLSDSMEEGTLVRWLRGDGDPVDAGDELAEIESDKAVMVYDAEAAGVLTRVVHEGETVAVGTVIGWLDAGEAVDRQRPRRPSFRPAASPVARRMAATHGVDLAAIDGTGPGGRITRNDVAVRIGAPEPVTAVGVRGELMTQELSRGQALVAKRMTASRRQVPDFEVRVRVDAEPLFDLRSRLKDEAATLVPSLNDFIVKAAALALREQPRANGAYQGAAWELYSRVNVGVAVATDDGLLVPTIFDADGASLGDIARRTRELSTRARAGTISPSELEGATFTVSNLGMFNVDSFTAVIPPNQAAILAVGAVARVPVIRGNAVVPGFVVELALACDHRILYGADAARLAARIRELLEHPYSLLLS